MVRKGSSYLKRRFSDIRNKMLQSLDIYPKSTNEIATDVRAGATFTVSAPAAATDANIVCL
jgi:hypothetical protein